MLTERVLRWTQGLQDTDLTQDHMAWEDDGLHYTAVLKRQPSTDDMGIERDIVEIATEQQGKRLRTQVQMKRLAFSHFTQLVDRWDTEIQLHDDEIAGRFHSNSEILLGYDRKVTPRFLGKVTTAARGFGIASWSSRKRRDEIFPAGLETRVGRIELPEKFVPVWPIDRTATLRCGRSRATRESPSTLMERTDGRRSIRHHLKNGSPLRPRRRISSLHAARPCM